MSLKQLKAIRYPLLLPNHKELERTMGRNLGFADFFFFFVQVIKITETLKLVHAMERTKRLMGIDAEWICLQSQRDCVTASRFLMSAIFFSSLLSPLVFSVGAANMSARIPSSS